MLNGKAVFFHDLPVVYDKTDRVLTLNGKNVYLGDLPVVIGERA